MKEIIRKQVIAHARKVAKCFSQKNCPSVILQEEARMMVELLVASQGLGILPLQKSETLAKKWYNISKGTEEVSCE